VDEAGVDRALAVIRSFFQSAAAAPATTKVNATAATNAATNATANATTNAGPY
jgi:hypothetical protein